MKKTRIFPRKEPRQQRSESLVHYILDGATRVFSSLGYTQATTNKIAEVAGVSIGSLYQYFPGKDAIVHALVKGRITTQMKNLDRILSESQLDPLATLIENLIRMIAEPMFENKR